LITLFCRGMDLYTHRLTRYWLKFKGSLPDLPPGLVLGCGVTAFDYADAISIVQQKVFKGKELPEIKTKIENIDISTLDKGHVLPNMKDPTLRGVWFPGGYE
jgi:hypothetical protein